MSVKSFVNAAKGRKVELAAGAVSGLASLATGAALSKRHHGQPSYLERKAALAKEKHKPGTEEESPSFPKKLHSLASKAHEQSARIMAEHPAVAGGAFAAKGFTSGMGAMRIARKIHKHVK